MRISTDNRLFSLSTKDHTTGKWSVLLDNEPREVCAERLEYLKRVGVRSARIYLSDREHAEKIPHSNRFTAGSPNRPAISAYIAWLMADRSRTAYVFPWSKSRGRESDRIRREIEGLRIKCVEVDPTDYTPSLYQLEIDAELNQQPIAA